MHKFTYTDNMHKVLNVCKCQFIFKLGSSILKTLSHSYPFCTCVRFVSETYQLLCYTETFSSHMQWQRWDMENPLLLSTDFRKVTLTILMILSPKQSEGSFFVFAMFLLLVFLILLSPPPNFMGKSSL